MGITNCRVTVDFAGAAPPTRGTGITGKIPVGIKDIVQIKNTSVECPTVKHSEVQLCDESGLAFLESLGCVGCRRSKPSCPVDLST